MVPSLCINPQVMGTCDFSKPFSGDADALIRKARELFGDKGSIQGDASSGSFTLSAMGLSVAGSYTISGQTLHIHIAKKPFGVGCGMIENQIEKYFPG